MKSWIHALKMLVAASLCTDARATTTISALDSPVRFDFQSFNGGGFAQEPAAGQLDSGNWSVSGASDSGGGFDGTWTSGDFARGTSSSSNVLAGGIYSFATGAGNLILGVQAGEQDFTPGSLTLRMENDTSQAIGGISLSFDIFIRNNENRASSIAFSWSTGTATTPGVFTNLPLLGHSTLATGDVSASWLTVNRSTFLSGVLLEPGEFFYARWTADDFGGTGSRDEFGIDNISLSAVPEPTMPLVFLLLGAGLLRRRRPHARGCR